MKVTLRFVLVVTFLAALISTASAATLPNLLAGRNAGMESWSSGDVLADNWTSFNYRTTGGSSPVTFFKAPNASFNNSGYRFDGSWSQGIDLTAIPYNSDPTAETKVGLYQRLPVTPGKAFIFTCWIRLNSNVTARAIGFDLGVDPTGGTDPSSASIVWSSPAWNDYDRVRGIWNSVTLSNKLNSSYATLFIRVTVKESVGRTDTNVVFIDKAGFFEVNDTVMPSLTSPGFESGFDTLGGYENPPTFVRNSNPSNPVYWVPFGWSQGYTDAYDFNWNKLGQAPSLMSDGLVDSDLNGVADDGHIRTGSHAARLLNNKGTCDWGVYQRFNVISGRMYTLSGYIKSWAGTVRGIGLDPSGGTDPDSAGVIWSYLDGDGTWGAMKTVATSQSNTMTAFLRLSGQNKAGGNEAYFDDVSITQAGLAPTAPTVTSPAAGTVQNTSQYTNISWTGESHSSYEIHVCTSSSSPTAGIVWDSGEVVSYASTHNNAGPLPYQGTYYIYVRLKNQAGWGNWSAGSQYIMNIQPPAAPVITKPLYNTTEDEKLDVFIEWTGSSYDAWQAVVCTSNNPNSTRVWDSGTVNSTGTNCTGGPLGPQGVYYIFVRLHNPAGWGNWSAGVRYITNMQPPAVTLTRPLNGYVNRTSPFVQVEFASTGSTSTYSHYQVRVARESDPPGTFIWDSGAITEFPTTPSDMAARRGKYLAGPLERTNSYRVYVRLGNAAGWGDWSSAASFQTNVEFRIIPEPQQMISYPGNGFDLGGNCRIIVSPSPTEKDMFTATLLQRKIAQLGGKYLPVVEYKNGMDLTSCIALGQIDGSNNSSNPAVQQILATWPEAAGKAPKDEGSLLGIGESNMVIGGYDEAGTFYAVQTVIQLFDYYRHSPIPGMFIYDWPDLKRRGILIRHWGFYERYDREFAEELISEVLARYKLNTVLLEIRLGMIYESHPDLNYAENAISKAETKDLVDIMKRYHIDVIPGGISSTHADQWITDTHPQLAIPGKLSDLDLNNPETQQFMRDIMDEQIEVCSPTVMHAGGDEGGAGVAAALQAINFAHDYLAAKGIRTAIWGDMIEAHGIGASLPQDIIIHDWDYDNKKLDYPSLQTWTNLGMTSWAAPYGVYDWAGNGCGWYNTFNYAISAKNYGSEGLIAFNKAILGTKNSTILSENTTAWNWYALDNYAQYPYYGEWAWTTGKPLNIPTPYEGKEMFLQQFSPDKPTGVSAQLSGSNVTLSWNAPINPSAARIRICYNIGHYPVHPYDGTTVGDYAVVPGQPGNMVHALPLGSSRLYYSFFACDNLEHYSAPAHALVDTGQPGISLSQLNSMDDYTVVGVSGIVTGAFGDHFYIEDENRTTGIRVESSHGVKVGDEVYVLGTVGPVDNGRSRGLTAIGSTGVHIIQHGQQVPKPLGMSIESIGGSDAGFKPGVDGGAGPNTFDLLVRCWGKVDQVLGDDLFVIDDGRTKAEVYIDPSQAVTQTVQKGQMVAVTGIAVPSLNPSIPRRILPRTDEDVTIIGN